MTLPIHEQGGLLSSEIDLRIKDAQQQQVTTLEQKLREHQEVIERRLTATDDGIQGNRDRILELKTDVAVLMASDSRQTELLESISANGQEWHEADLEYRSSMIQRVTVIEIEQKLLSDQVNIIRWFVATSAGLTKTLGVCVKLLCTEEFWKIFGTGALLLILSHFFPYLFQLLRHITATQ